MPKMLNDLKVLVVEDDPRSQNFLKRVLGAFGVSEVFTADDGRYAQEFLETAEDLVDLIICDWRMPRMSGLDLLQQVRMTYPDMPFMMLTGSKDMESVKDAKKLNVDAYVAKPYSPQVLKQKLVELAKRQAWRRYNKLRSLLESYGNLVTRQAGALPLGRLLQNYADNPTEENWRWIFDRFEQVNETASAAI